MCVLCVVVAGVFFNHRYEYFDLQKVILGQVKLQSFICLSQEKSIGFLLHCDQAYLLDSLE